jgi:hypothetical protein
VKNYPNVTNTHFFLHGKVFGLKKPQKATMQLLLIPK